MQPARSGTTTLRPIPGLDEIGRDPRCAATLGRSALISLLLRNAVVQSAIAAQLSAIESVDAPTPVIEDGDIKMLTPDGAALLIHKPRRWIIENARRLPWVVRVSRKTFLCSEAGIRKWLATRRA